MIENWYRTEDKCYFPDCPRNCCCLGDDKINERNLPPLEQVLQESWDKVKRQIELEGV